MNTLKDKDAYLILSDGTVYCGKSFGAEGTVYGELICSTSMVGYQETLTDPCNYGQVVVQTFPLLGNYGINSIDGESDKVCASGYVVREKCDFPSNFRCETTLDEYLKTNNVVGIYDIDTRALTHKIKDNTISGCAITTQLPENIEEVLHYINSNKNTDRVKNVSCKKDYVCECENKKYTVVLYDFGVRKSLVDELKKCGCEVVVVPYNTSVTEVLKYNPDGFVLSDGPFASAENDMLKEIVSDILDTKLPVIATGISHQIVAQLCGGKIEKLAFGHRGSNVPVTEVETGKVYITSQNHGYAVISDSIDEDLADVQYINTNDKTCEGIKLKNADVITVQFRPEECADTDGKTLFDKFTKMMEGRK